MYVPSQVIPNSEFVKLGLDTSDEWISSRTGVRQRHLVRDETTSFMAVRAANEALHVAGVSAGDIDLIIVATATPDHVMPATASLVQDRIGAKNAGAMDLNAACSGFVYALTTAAGLVESGRSKKALVIGADELSIHLDWKDRSTCVLFGDGAGAVVLEAGNAPGVMASDVGSDGSGAGLLTIPAGARTHNAHYVSNAKKGSNGKNGASHEALHHGDYYLRMNGPQIFRAATQMMAKASEKVLAESGLSVGDVDLYIPHQANSRIMETTAKRLGLDESKVFSNVEDYGNTSAASIPIALYEALSAERLTVGDNLVLASFGAGLSWAALALRWTAPIPERTRWQPVRSEVDRRFAELRSLVRRQGWRVRGEIGRRLGREEE
jgi:3-oxoacyl-[acyl-carrier-protein] synthase-3